MSTRRTSAYSFRWHRLLCRHLLPTYATLRFLPAVLLLCYEGALWEEDLTWLTWTHPALAQHVVTSCYVAALAFEGCWTVLVRRDLMQFRPEGVERMPTLPFWHLLADVIMLSCMQCLGGTSIAVQAATSSLIFVLLAGGPFLLVFRATRRDFQEKSLFLNGPIKAPLRKLPLGHQLVVGAGMIVSMALTLYQACSLFMQLEPFCQPHILLELPRLPAIMLASMAVCVACAAGDAVGFVRLYHLRRRAFWLLVPCLLLPAAADVLPLGLVLTLGTMSNAEFQSAMLNLVGIQLILPLGILAVLAGYYGLLRRNMLS